MPKSKKTNNENFKETYIDPFTDFGFKKLFGEEDSKEYLIDFLNSVFHDFIPKIQELTYHKNEHLGNKKLDRNVVFDLYCKDPQGNRFIIELPKAKQDYFKQRTLFYTTFAIQEQAKKGKEWDFNLSPVYCISLLNFCLDNNKNNKYITKAKVLDIDNHQTVIEELNFAFIECPKFTKDIKKDSSMQDKWIYVLTHLNELQNKPEELQEKLFEEFFQKANILKLNPKELRDYNASITYYRDIHNIEAQNFEKGKSEGLEEGLQKGLQKGLQTGLVEGEIKAKLEIAKKMKLRNIPIEFIIEDTGLTKEQIERI